MADPVTMMVVSTALTAGGELAEGDAAVRASKYEAKQLEQQANARYAQGTREAYEAARAGDILESDAIAQMAAGGGGVDAEHLAKIKAESDYNALAALYEGETEAAGIRQKAEAVKYGGKVKQKAARTRALSTVISGGSKAYQGYKAP